MTPASRRTTSPCLIYLIGFMGSGKSSVGRRLARLLEMPFVDLDREIELEAGLSIPEIFRSQGEAAFRRLEAQALEEQSRRQQAVVATGGGVVERRANLELMLSTGEVVWLDVDFDTLERRLERNAGSRPLFQTPEQALELYRSRLAAYRRCHRRIDAGSASPTELARSIADLLETDACDT